MDLLGFSHSEMVGKTVAEFSSLKDLESNKVMLERLQKDGVVRYDNLPLQARDGRKIAVDFISNVYQEGGRSVIQCNIRDITERRRAEEHVRLLTIELERRVAERTAEMQAVNEELESFSYSVSHDLRAPLRHVLGFVDLLQKDAGTSLSEKGIRYLKTISDSAARMGSLIDDLLSFSRIGKTKLQKTDVELDQLVEETLHDFKVETEERKVEFNVHELPVVWADRALLRLVLVNLVSNAVKFTSARVEAKIEIGCVSDSVGEKVIFIRDNGAGFNPKYTDKLFGVFQRLHPQKEFEGTGIGLANVQRILVRHGGRAWAEGVENVGATFYFSIPGRNSQ
jgi:PAS domain S-box-containing protein